MRPVLLAALVLALFPAGSPAQGKILPAKGTIKSTNVDSGRGFITIDVVGSGETEFMAVPRVTSAKDGGSMISLSLLKPGSYVEFTYNGTTKVLLAVNVVPRPKTAEAAPAGNAAEIRAKLSKLRAEAAALEKQLAEIELKGVKPGSAAPRLMKLGQVVQLLVSPGGFGSDLMVREVVDDKTLIVHWRTDTVDFMVRGHPTKGIADRQIVEIDGAWRVTDTVRHLGTTMFVVEPIGTPAKK